MSHQRGCKICGAFWHKQNHCPELDALVQPDYRLTMRRVRWSAWMLNHWWLVGTPDMDALLR